MALNAGCAHTSDFMQKSQTEHTNKTEEEEKNDFEAKNCVLALNGHIWRETIGKNETETLSRCSCNVV